MFRNNELKKLEDSLYDGDYRLDKKISAKEELELNMGRDVWFWNDVNSPGAKESLASLHHASFFSKNENNKGAGLTRQANSQTNVTKQAKLGENNTDLVKEEKYTYNLRHAPNKYIKRF